MTIAFINGEFLLIEEATISPMDRGFLFADGVYEVIPVYQGKLFRLEEHLHRLQRSLKEISLPFTIETAYWKKIFTQLISHNGNGNQSLYFQITRGVAAGMVRDPFFPAEVHPTLFAFSRPYLLKSMETLAKGISAITLEDIRWERCDIKSIALLANVLLRQKAHSQGADEAILIHQGFAIEGTSSNLFIVKDNVLITPPTGPEILGGITRDVVLELAKKHAIPYKETPIPEKDLLTADEIWVTGSLREVQPIVRLNNTPVGNGSAGPLWKTMIEHYQQFKNEPCA